MKIPWVCAPGLLVLILTGCRTGRLSDRGDSSSSRTPEARAVAYLSREVPRWSRENHCFSCHNNGDAARALYVASALGYRVSKKALADTTDWLQRPDQWENNKGNPAFSDQRLAAIQFTAALATAIATKHISNPRALLIAARKLMPEQNSDGAWRIEPENVLGSPATYGTHLASVTVMKALKNVRDDRVSEALQKGEAWLRGSTRAGVLDSASVSMGLTGREDPQAAAKRRQFLELARRSQTRDGGWGPYADSPPEPFDTAIVLLALAELPREFDVEILLRRGRDFLVRTQWPDGHWPETTRPPRGESYAQRISTTGWATLALLQTRVERK